MLGQDNQDNKKWLALQLLKTLRKNILTRSYRDMVRFVCGLFTVGEIEDLLRRSAVREKILDHLSSDGSLSFKKVAEETRASEELVRRVWRAMCDEYPAEISMPANFCVAIPKQSRAQKLVESILLEAGFRIDEKGKVLVDVRNGIEPIPYRLVRGSLIPMHLKMGNVQCALLGNDKIKEAMAKARLHDHSPLDIEVRAQFFIDAFRMCIAVPKDKAEEANRQGYAYLNNKVIGTSYPETLKEFLASKGVVAKEIMELDGDVEASCRDFGVAAVMDITETGNSLKKHGLVVLGRPLYAGDMSLICRHSSPNRPAMHEGVMERFMERLQSSEELKAA